ncbi:hypothetical protein THERMOT_1035 [Bathymodiolus thermophilus thioautotrophic gill symbiont]|nr:hypothetical protein THERMOT_1035 [Bathymodiolus thermophilus thioautotrophic gill symbiont]
MQALLMGIFFILFKKRRYTFMNKTFILKLFLNYDCGF